MIANLLRVAGIALLCAMIVLAFLAPLPGQSLLARAILNALHTFAFAVFAFALDTYIGRRRRLSTLLLSSTLLLLALAFVSELVQPSTGRSYSTDDILRDFLGIAIGHIAYLLFKRSSIKQPRRLAYGMLLSLLVLLGLSQPLWAWYLSTTKPQWPILADFEHPRSLAYIETVNPDSVAREMAPSSWQRNNSNVIRISKDSSSFSGFSLLDVYPDWQSLSHFGFDVFNPADHPVELNLRINDSHHNNQYHDRFNRSFMVMPGTSSPSVNIDDMRNLGAAANDSRDMDLSSIEGIAFFMTLSNAGDILYLDNIQVR